MTNIEFLIFWGLCLAVMVSLAVVVGILELKQKKTDRLREAEAEERREAYIQKLEKKQLWNSNFAESEKLFEGGADK